MAGPLGGRSARWPVRSFDTNRRYDGGSDLAPADIGQVNPRVQPGSPLELVPVGRTATLGHGPSVAAGPGMTTVTAPQRLVSL